MIPSLHVVEPMSAAEWAPWVTPDEAAEAAQFGSERRRAEFLTWRAVVRRELGVDTAIAYNEVGAPVLTNRDVHLSVSHCAGRVAVCISEKPCTVDIEPELRDFSRAASRYMAPEERALTDDPLLPGVVWCAKEALYKYAGRRELDFLHGIRVERADLEAGRLTGRIENGEPVELSVHREGGYIIVYIL